MAPSTKLNYEDVHNVLNAITGLQSCEMRGIYGHFQELRSLSPLIETPLFQPEEFASNFGMMQGMFKAERQNTVDFGQKEASGNVLRGIFMSIVRKALLLKYPDDNFLVDHEYKVLPDKKFALDEAILAIIQLPRPNSRKILFGVEYKPKVSASLEDIPCHHLSETLLQAYYLRKRFTHNILHCLTDLEDFHYFLICTSVEKPFHIKNYWYKTCDLTNSTAVNKHLQFLIDTISVETISITI